MADEPDEAARAGRVRRLTDPSLLLSVVTRVQAMGAILSEILVTPADDDESAARDAEPAAATSTAEAAAPNLALGTVTEDDDWDVWAHADTDRTRARRVPAELLERLAHEASGLRAVWDATRAAVDATPGADMSVDEQMHLLDTLRAYQARQAYVYLLTQRDSRELGGDAPGHAGRCHGRDLERRCRHVVARATQCALGLEEHGPGVSMQRTHRSSARGRPSRATRRRGRARRRHGTRPRCAARRGRLCERGGVPLSDGENARCRYGSCAGWIACLPSKPSCAPSSHSSSR